jgi:hypothetical protein
MILNQSINSPNYFPFEKYIVKFSKHLIGFDDYDNWKKRPYRVIYGGGSRDGVRDKLYRKYFHNEYVDKIYTSSQVFDPNITMCKIPHVKLMEQYQMSRFGLLITDPLYSSLGWQTQRYFEYLLSGMIPVFDSGCDYLKLNHGLELSASESWTRVNLLQRDDYVYLKDLYGEFLKQTSDFMDSSTGLLASVLELINVY